MQKMAYNNLIALLKCMCFWENDYTCLSINISFLIALKYAFDLPPIHKWSKIGAIFGLFRDATLKQISTVVVFLHADLCLLACLRARNSRGTLIHYHGILLVNQGTAKEQIATSVTLPGRVHAWHTSLETPHTNYLGILPINRSTFGENKPVCSVFSDFFPSKE